MKVSGEGSWVGRDLEHVYEEEGDERRRTVDRLYRTYAKQESRLVHGPFWDIRL
jgi:hypothetical protein